jgi:hypothetical protein
MNMDNELQKHYAQLLGIGSPWEVKAVELKLAEKQVAIELSWQWGAAAKCPECGRQCSIHDSAPERTWRHLDTMQFETLIRARVPRADCPEHGVKTMQVPWAAPQGRFTLLFERCGQFRLSVLGVLRAPVNFRFGGRLRRRGFAADRASLGSFAPASRNGRAPVGGSFRPLGAGGVIAAR